MVLHATTMVPTLTAAMPYQNRFNHGVGCTTDLVAPKNIHAHSFVHRGAAGKWRYTEHPFWVSASPFCWMRGQSPDLYSALASSKLVILKGDLNYRCVSSANAMNASAILNGCSRHGALVGASGCVL